MEKLYRRIGFRLISESLEYEFKDDLIIDLTLSTVNLKSRQYIFRWQISPCCPYALLLTVREKVIASMRD